MTTGKNVFLVIVENSFLSQVTYYTWDATCKVAQHEYMREDSMQLQCWGTTC